MTFRARVKESITSNTPTHATAIFWLVIITIGLIKPDGLFVHHPTAGGSTAAYLISGVTLGFGLKSFTVSCHSNHANSIFSENDWFALGLMLVGIGTYYLCFAITFT
jgi:hypothetical protein